MSSLETAFLHLSFSTYHEEPVEELFREHDFEPDLSEDLGSAQFSHIIPEDNDYQPYSDEDTTSEEEEESTTSESDEGSAASDSDVIIVDSSLQASKVRFTILFTVNV